MRFEMILVLDFLYTRQTRLACFVIFYNCQAYFDACSMYAIKSARSCAFFKPANTIFVPGMYFFGFSRYSNKVSLDQVMAKKNNMYIKKFSIIFKKHCKIKKYTFCYICICVTITRGLTSFSAYYSMEIRSYFMFSTSFNCMALCTFLYKELIKKRKLFSHKQIFNNFLKQSLILVQTWVEIVGDNY